MNNRSHLAPRFLPPLVVGLGALVIVVASTYLTPAIGEGSPAVAPSESHDAAEAWAKLLLEPSYTNARSERDAESASDTRRPKVQIQARRYVESQPEVEAPVAPPASLPNAQPAPTVVAPTPVPPSPTPTVVPPAPPGAPSCRTAGMGGFAAALFDAINGARAANGMAPLAPSGCATYVAQLRSQDMATNAYFAHTSPSGATAFSLLGSYGVPYAWAGENLARNNYADAETVSVAIDALMASDGHRANILHGNYTQLGVGYAVDGQGIRYYTMIFIGP